MMLKTKSKLIEFDFFDFRIFETTNLEEQQKNNIQFTVLENKLNVAIFDDYDCIFAIDLDLDDVTRIKEQMIKISNLFRASKIVQKYL